MISMMVANLRYHPAMSKSLPVLQDRLFEAALLYLGRYEASVQALRRVLRRRVERWMREGRIDEDDDRNAAVEAVIARLSGLGAVDDQRYAGNKAASLFRSGRSERAIRLWLAARGIAADLLDEAVRNRAEETDGTDDPDFIAARRFAQKKRLGPFRLPEQRALKRDRDLAQLGRAGFTWAVARRVIDEEE
jgi:regulatory protein